MKAWALDDNLAEAHVALGELKLYYEWDWEGAQAAFVRALELNPNLPEAHRRYGWYLLLIGRPEDVLVELKKAKAGGTNCAALYSGTRMAVSASCNATYPKTNSPKGLRRTTVPL
jgi:Tfp pilus assembly protein PilF